MRRAPPRPKPGSVKRTCIGPCGKQFWSEGPWNHVCPKCNAANEANPLCENRAHAGCNVHFDDDRSLFPLEFEE